MAAIQFIKAIIWIFEQKRLHTLVSPFLAESHSPYWYINIAEGTALVRTAALAERLF